MTAAIRVQSIFRPDVAVDLDPWSANPLADDAQQSVPDLFVRACACSGAPPTMFGFGDTPAYLASGVDTRWLDLLPWRVRHAAAVEPSTEAVLGYVKRFGHNGDAYVWAPGLDEYIARFRAWLGDGWASTVAQSTEFVAGGGRRTDSGHVGAALVAA